jgi:hypothetical protein
MKKLLIILLCLPMIGFAQSVPQGINYQAVARDVNGDVLMSQALTIQFSVISDITTSAVSWQETHTVSTNDYGLYTAIIGQGTTTNGGSSLTFDSINWGASNHLLKVEVDYGGGLIDMGTTAFMSVPYSLYSANPGPKGIQGLPGVDGDDGQDGNDGQNGYNGQDGNDGNDGAQGIAGDDGLNGTNGIDGIDGLGGVTTAGTGVSVSGVGTSVSPYVVSTTPSAVTYSIGDTAQGGIVFYVSPDGKNGLVAATVDQFTSSNWYNASDVISSPLNHTSEGQKFRDWRLPTKYELNEMYLNLHQLGLGGFANYGYWSSTELDNYDAWRQNFISGFQYVYVKNNYGPVRAVRAF